MRAPGGARRRAGRVASRPGLDRAARALSLRDMARIYALVAALMGAFAQAPAPTSPQAPVRISSGLAEAPASAGFADARVVVLSGDDRERRRVLARWRAAGADAALAVPAAWAAPLAAGELAARLTSPHRLSLRVHGYQPGAAAASHDAVLRFVYEADDTRARDVEHALSASTPRALAGVARELDAHRGALTARAGRHAFEHARRHLRNLEQLAALEHTRSRAYGAELTARFEADNLKWLADHDAFGAPLLVWPT